MNQSKFYKILIPVLLLISLHVSAQNTNSNSPSERADKELSVFRKKILMTAEQNSAMYELLKAYYTSMQQLSTEKEVTVRTEKIKKITSDREQGISRILNPQQQLTYQVFMDSMIQARNKRLNH